MTRHRGVLCERYKHDRRDNRCDGTVTARSVCEMATMITVFGFLFVLFVRSLPGIAHQRLLARSSRLDVDRFRDFYACLSGIGTAEHQLRAVQRHRIGNPRRVKKVEIMYRPMN